MVDVKKRELRVVEITTGKIVHRVELSDPSDRYAERVMAGLMRNMNLDVYSVEDSGDDKPAAKPKAKKAPKAKAKK